MMKPVAAFHARSIGLDVTEPAVAERDFGAALDSTDVMSLPKRA